MKTLQRAYVIGTIFCCLLCLMARGEAQNLADRVVVVQNKASPVSMAVAKDYAQKRGVRNIVSVQCADSALNRGNETLTFAEYESRIEKPLHAFLAAHPKVDFIVLTKGIPIRIKDAHGRGLGNKQPSLDSTLAALDYAKDPKAINVPISDGGFTGTAWANRYWQAKERFSHAKFGGYLVTRLDGYTQADAMALTARSLAAEQHPPNGAILLDTCKIFGYADRAMQPVQLFATPPEPGKTLPPLRDISYSHFNADMQKAADILRARHLPVELDETNVFVGNRTNLMGYTSWGSNDRAYKPDAYHSLRFAPGAICDTAVSTSGRTFLPTTGGQSLIADLIAQGITGTKCYCDEPLLTAIASPSVLFDRYTSGWTLAESFYAASRFVGWEDIVIGDPLCRPYRPRKK
jgi:uncharacterized protein (TIGR03790 family)